MKSGLISADILQQLQSAPHLWIGFSGGLDSTVLLHYLVHEINSAKITAVHINHGLSRFADSWQHHCQAIAASLNIQFQKIDVELNADNNNNVEERARNARYKAFESLMGPQDALILGHHQNDQAETVLLQLFRGAGVDGLAAMPIFKPFACGTLYRPFLNCSRQQLEAYAANHQLKWIEDDSNTNCTYSRNFIRHQVLPLIEQRWPEVTKNLARTAIHCQTAKMQIKDKVTSGFDLNDLKLNLNQFLGLDSLTYQTVLRHWLQTHGIPLPATVVLNKILTEIIQAKSDANPQIQWSGWTVRRYRHYLYLTKNNPPVCNHSQVWLDFPNRLVLSNGQQLSAHLIIDGLIVKNDDRVEIRFRQSGEQLYLNGHHRSLKKLFQQWQIPVWLRACIPLLYINDRLAAVVGYAVNDTFRSRGSRGYEINIQADSPLNHP